MANEQFVKVHCNNALPMNSMGVELWQHVGEPIRRWMDHILRTLPQGDQGIAWEGQTNVTDADSFSTHLRDHRCWCSTSCWPFSRGKMVNLACSFTHSLRTARFHLCRPSPLPFAIPGETSPPPTRGLDRHLRPSPKRQVHWRPFRVVQWHTKRNLSNNPMGIQPTHDCCTHPSPSPKNKGIIKGLLMGSFNTPNDKSVAAVNSHHCFAHRGLS